ncbi:pentapeptide repeat-containing protein [Rhodococcus kronopolitis]|uniref:Pentapeptide repeat-containing protein n=1 Tax=Rhodococcus kronopolitis TaxID=1460226 RepID=A0ABV9G0A8_9NOCA
MNDPARVAVGSRRVSGRGSLARRCAAVLAGTGVAFAGIAALAPTAGAAVINGCEIVAKPTAEKFTDCAKANLAGAALGDLDLSFANLAGANLSGATLEKSNLSGANLTGVNLNSALASGVNLTGANLSNANGTDAVLDKADLGGANLKGATFTGASLIGANLKDASDADLTGAITKAGQGDGSLDSVLDGRSLIGSSFIGMDTIGIIGGGGALPPAKTPALIDLSFVGSSTFAQQDLLPPTGGGTGGATTGGATTGGAPTGGASSIG